MNKFRKICLISLSLISSFAFANENHEEKSRETMNVPLVVSFVGNELFMTSGKSIVTNCGLGMLGNTVYQVNGFQGSSLYNITHEVNGAQASGVFNVNAGDFSGFQGTAVLNVNAGDFNGWQGSAVANVNAGDFNGWQGSAVANVNAGDFKGAQTAAVCNVNAGDISGFQGAGVMNITCADESDGVQAAAVLNVHKGKLNGAQFGIINICTDDVGFQFGLINISKNGILEVGAAYTSNNNLRLSFSSGKEYLYTVIGFSCNSPIWKKDHFQFKLFDNFATFAGLGTRQKFGMFNFDLEALWTNAFYYKNDKHGKGYTSNSGYLSGRVAAGVTPVKHINFFGGYTAAFEHPDFCNSSAAFSHMRSNLKTHFDNGFTVHHEFDVGVKIQIQ